MTATYEIVTTDQLREGDIVAHSGMRLAIDQPIRTIPGHIPGMPAYATDARIDNWTELLDQAAADKTNRIVNSTAAFIVRHSSHDDQGAHRWTIQGNSLACWSREAVQIGLAPQAGVERPIFESDADIADYYRVGDDDETTSYRTF